MLEGRPDGPAVVEPAHRWPSGTHTGLSPAETWDRLRAGATYHELFAAAAARRGEHRDGWSYAA